MTEPNVERRVSLTQEELHLIIKDAVGVALAEQTPKLLHCGMDIAVHNKQHEALDKLLEAFTKIDNIKWDILRTLAKGVVGGSIVLIGWGLYHRVIEGVLK